MNHLTQSLCHLLDNNGKGICFQLALENGVKVANLRAANVKQDVNNFETKIRRSTRIDLKTVLQEIADRIWFMKMNYDVNLLSGHTQFLLDQFLVRISIEVYTMFIS
jgi:hypothetical protein